jgi:uncharacterized repeat protein (TIGR01451 family)
MTTARSARPDTAFQTAATAAAAFCLALLALTPALNAGSTKSLLAQGQAVDPVGLGKIGTWTGPRCPGGEIRYGVTLRNQGIFAATAQILDPIPGHTSFVQGSATNGAFFNGLTNEVVWQGVLLPGAEHTISFSVRVDLGTPDGTGILNRVTGRLISGEEVAQKQFDVVSTVACSNELAIEFKKTSDPDDPLCPGSLIQYELRLTNPAANGEAVSAVLADPVPNGTTFDLGSHTTNPPTPPATFDPVRGVEWSGTLDPGETVVVRYRVRIDPGVPNGTLITNLAAAELEDLQGEDSVDGEAETTDEVDCGLTIELEKRSFPGGELCPGDRVLYEVELTNPATNGKALTGGIVDRIPRRMEFDGGLVSTEPTARFDGVAEEVEWEGTLEPGKSVVVSFFVRVRSGTAPGTLITNEADGILADLAEQETVTDRAEVTDEVIECDVRPCPLQVEGLVEDSTGNGQGSLYPVPFSRVWLFDLEDETLPAAPLSEGKHPAFAARRTRRTFETGLENEAFPSPGQAAYEFDLATFNVSRCPPRTAVVSALWDGDDRFAVSPRNPVGGRYVPAYLTRCISDRPDEVLPGGPCYQWRFDGTAFVPWNPMTGENAEVRFTYGSSPSNAQSVRVVRDPTTDPPLSEAWDLGSNVPADFFFQDAAHMYFFSYKAMEYIDGLGREVRRVLGEIAEEEDEEPKELLLSPVLITPHDRDCPSGCTWSAPQLADDPLAPLPGRLPLAFGGLADSGATVRAGALVAFDSDASSSRFPGAPSPDTGDKPDNREWHELGHYWMLQLYGGDWPGGYRSDTADCREEPPAMPPVPPGHGDGNHCGYANRSTTDSYIEGFAELTSMLIADRYEDPQPALYHFRGSDRNLEVDHQVWGPYTAVLSDGEATALELLDPRDEDFAIAGILWDLYDAGTATEPKAPGVASDAIRTEDRSEEAAAEIFARIRQELPEDLASLFGTLSSAFPGDRDGDGFGDVEEIFIAHGAFADTERDLRHDLEEIPGDTGSPKLPARPLRLSREPVPNGYIGLGIVVEGGFPIAPYGFPVHLRYEFDPPFDHYDHERTVRSRGRLYLNMPPPLYQPCRLTITVRGSGASADLRSDPLVITCAEYWGAIEAGEPSLGGRTFVLETEKPPEPPPGPWLTSPDLAGFEAKVRITPRGGEPVAGVAEPICVVESLCVSGALPGRPEVFVKVIGPRPNGKLWVQISRFTPSEVEVWLRQVATGIVRYYRLAPVGATSDDVSGLQDREAFDPAGAGSTVPRGAVLPGAAVEPFALSSMSSALGPRLEPGEPQPPAAVEWLTTAELPGFRFKALITPAGGQGVGGHGVGLCIPETLCIQGALAGRPEVFAKIIGPRPNGFLWLQAARFTPSRVELWVEQEGTDTVRYYRLEPIGPGLDDVSGLQDREAFTP